MSILSYIQIFSSYFCGILLYFLPSLITYKRFSLIMAIISTIVLGLEIIKRKAKVTKLFLIIVAVYLSIIFSYAFITPLFYRETPVAMHDSQLLVIIGQIFPAALTATFIADNDKAQMHMKKMVPIVSLLFTVVALMCVLNPSSMTSGGLTDNENGFNYQKVSYIAAYAAALMEYHLICRKNNMQLAIFNKKAMIVICLASIFANMVTVLISGGRGGFVAFFTFSIISLYYLMKSINFKLTPRRICYGLAIIFVVAIGVGYVMTFVSSTSISTSGFYRILKLLNGGGDSGRASKRVAAIASFLNSAVVGHGFGSVFWEIRTYSHNLFLDTLVETGILGIMVLIGVLVYGSKCFILLVKRDFTEVFWGYIIACGLVLSMFSGYYLTHFPLWWGLFFVISKKKKIIKSL